MTRHSLRSFGLIALVATLLTDCSARAAAPPPAKPVVAVAIEAATVATPVAMYRGPGSVVAAHLYRLAFEVSGRVTHVNADVGDRVGAGDVLATLDDTEQHAQLRQSEAQAAQAVAQADRARHGARPQEREQALQGVAAARAQLMRTQAAAQLARKNDERSRQLLSSGYISAQAADVNHIALVDADEQVAGARAQYMAAEQNAALIQSGSREEDQRAAQAQAAAAGAATDLAATTLRKTILHAPADAYVQSRAVEPGDTTQPGAVVLTLTDAAEPDVLVDVPEARRTGIDAGTHATVYVNGRAVSGRVVRLEPAADPATRSTSARVHAGGLGLRPGAVVDVALGERRIAAAGIEPAALLERDGQTMVELYDAVHRSVRLQRVRVVDASGVRTLVAGIAPGTPVVTLGQHDVVPGDRVRIVER